MPHKRGQVHAILTSFWVVLLQRIMMEEQAQQYLKADNPAVTVPYQ